MAQLFFCERPARVTSRRLSTRACAAVACLIGALAGTAPAGAQTRADEIAGQQREKAAEARPYEPNRVERFFGQLESGRWFIGEPRGLYPILGTVALGGGLAGGAGYRRYLGYDSYVDASALYSIYGYKKAEITGHTPDHFGNRVDLTGTIGWLDATKLPFYGLGPDSRLGRETNYRLAHSYIEGVATVRPARWLDLRFDGGVDDYDQSGGRGSSLSIEQIFNADTAPLLGQDPRYLRGQASAIVYWLTSPGYSRSGGLYRLAYEQFNPQRGDGGSFGMLHTEIVQHLPILRDTWVASFRARGDSIVNPSDVVPYFLMPTLGGGDTLRGFATRRFVDRHALLLSGEFRWLPNRRVFDMALFVDAGKVAPVRDQLSLQNMHVDYGVGMRFHTPTDTVLRFDLAKSREGFRFVVSGSPAF
jgi:hypothetical protein